MDVEILLYVNSFLGASDKFDYNYRLLANNELTKSLPLITLFWVFWFLRPREGYPYREKVLASGCIAIVAIVVGRVLAVALPFRERPIHDASVQSLIEGPVSTRVLEGWSSMPSDHAVLFAALCLCIFSMHKLTGLLISCYCFAVVLLPRIMYGLHWPSDVLVGILVGCATTALLLPPISRAFRASGALEFLVRREAILYPAMFLLSFQMATMFKAAREMADLAFRAIAFVT